MTGRRKKMGGRIILAVVVCLLFFGIGMPVRASEEQPTSGKCGDNITWEIEKLATAGREDDTLKLTGSGAMYDYLEKMENDFSYWYEAHPPWEGYSFIGVSLDDRITTIGDGAFAHFTLYDVKQGEINFFQNGTMVLPKNVTSIGRQAFDNASIRTLYIGPEVRKIGQGAFVSSHIEDLFVAGTSLDFSAVDGVFAYSMLETIHAPKGSKAEAYAKANGYAYEEWDGTDYGKTSHTVTLDAGDGVFPETVQSSRYTVSGDRKTAVRKVDMSDDAVPLPDIAPVLTGKYFGGWYHGNALFDFGVPLKQDITLTAKWLEEPAAPVLTIKNDTERSVRLSWGMQLDADLKGYRVYRADTADAAFAKITANDLSVGSTSYTDDIDEKDIPKKMAYRYYIEAVYEKDGTETLIASNKASCNGMLTNAGLISQTGGAYVGARIVDQNGREISSLMIHEGETSGELFLALVKRDGTTVLWQDAWKDIAGEVSFRWGLGLPYPFSYPESSWSGDMAPYAYARFPIGYLYDESCTRLKGLKNTAGQQLYLYVEGQPGFLTVIPVTVEAAEPGKEYPSYEKDGIVTDDLQAGLQILRDAVRNRENCAEVYIRKSACDSSIAAYQALRDQDKSDNPSGDPRGGYIPDWLEAEVFDINRNRPGMKPWEGDYAYYAIQVGSSNANTEYPEKIYGEEYYKLMLEVNQFATTAEQEAAVDAKVEQLLTGRLAGVRGKSAYARAKAVYDYVSTSMHYDDSDPVHHYAYGGLCKGKATCMGFALSFQRLASELGLESKVLMGLDGGAHTYNLVKIQGKYYYLDCSAKKFLKGKNTFQHALLQDRYLSTAFQTYYMSQIAENDYVGGQDSALSGAAVRALTDEEISAVSEGMYTGIADRTKAKYAIKGTVIEVTPYDKTHPLKPVYEANADKQNYVLAFRLMIDQAKLDENGTVTLLAGEMSSDVFTKANSTLKDGYLDILCPIEEGGISIAVDYDTGDENASQYEAVIYTMDLSKLVKASVRLSGTAQEQADAVEKTGIELSGPTVKYQNDDRQVTVVYDAVAYSPAINTKNTGLAETAGNYAALRISAPESMLGTKVLSDSTAEFAQGADGCSFRWGLNQAYLDCFCKMEKGKDKTLTIKWAGKETRTQTIILRAPLDCYMETDGADMDAAKKVAFNGLPSTLYVGQSQIADVKVTRAYEKDRVRLSFTSDDSTVLSVNRVTGEMRALRPGKVTLTVRAAGLDRKGKVVSASKKITVKQVPAPAGVRITEVKDTSAAAVWKSNKNSQWTEGYAVPYVDSLGSNARAWKVSVEAALSGAGLDNGMPENMTAEQRQTLETRLSETLCPGSEGKVVTASGLTADGRLAWTSGLRTNTAYVFYLRSMAENAAGEISYTGWMSGKIKTKMPVLAKIQLTAYDAAGVPLAWNNQENDGYSYTDPTDEMLPAELRYELSATGVWENDKDIFKNPSYKSTNAKVVKVDNKGKLSLGGQAGTTEIYVTGKDTGGAVRESNRIKIRVVKSLQTIQDKTTAMMLGQSVSVQELVGCDVKGSADAFKMEKVDLAAMVDELESAGKDCFTVTYPAGEKEKAVITPFAYPVDEKSGEPKNGAGLTLSVKLYDKAGEGKQLIDTKKAVIKVKDMPAPAISKVTALDTSADITFKPNAVVREISGAQYYYTLTLTNKSTGEEKIYRARTAESQAAENGVDQTAQEDAGNTFAYEPLYDKKGKLTSWRCTIDGLTSATVYEAVATANYLPIRSGQNGQQAGTAPVQKASGRKNFTTLKPVIAVENGMKVSLVSMEALWADPNAAGQEITHDETVVLNNGQTYVLFAEIGDYDRIMGTDRIKWSVTSDPKGAAVVKASADSYTAKLTLSRCGTVKVQAVSTLSKKVVCSFTVEVQPYQSNLSSAQAGGNKDEE